MSQTVVDSTLSAAEQLEQEWQLFQRVESGLAQHLSRVWETATPVVVIGRSSVPAEHVFEDACRADNVPVLRRR